MGIWECEKREMKKGAYLSPFLEHPCLSVGFKPAKGCCPTQYHLWAQYSLHDKALDASLSPQGGLVTHVEDGRDSENRGKSVAEEEINTCLIVLAILS